MMLISIIRFASHDWIFEQYIKPDFFFTYYGFDWIKPLQGKGMYLVFGLMGISAFGIMTGLFYRICSVLFFLSFTYVELIDKTNYLNHYYFVSLVAFLLIFLPAHQYFSLDVLRKPSIEKKQVPAWTLTILKFQLGIVYFYAGLAKLNYDWLVNALPLKIWLPAKSNLPLIGWVFNTKWAPYLFSWCGALYDLSIPFLLLSRLTRIFAYGAVILFHVLTALLFQIGMFPYIMILFTLIFFPAQYHQNAIDLLRRIARNFYKNVFNKGIGFLVHKNETSLKKEPGSYEGNKFSFHQVGKYALYLYILIQLLLPFRYLCYPGNLYWTEQGYRFSWRVMLMEKAGYVVFHIYDPVSGKMEQANNFTYLTQTQEKQMSTQPDMILQFAHYLKEKYQEKGFIEPHITAESYVTLNGRRSRPFIDPAVNLVEIKEGWKHKEWILPADFK